MRRGAVNLVLALLDPVAVDVVCDVVVAKYGFVPCQVYVVGIRATRGRQRLDLRGIGMSFGNDWTSRERSLLHVVDSYQIGIRCRRSDAIVYVRELRLVDVVDRYRSYRIQVLEVVGCQIGVIGRDGSAVNLKLIAALVQFR